MTTLNDKTNDYKYDYSPVSFQLIVNGKPVEDLSSVSQYLKIYSGKY